MDYLKLVSNDGRMVLGELLTFEGEVMEILVQVPDNYQLGEKIKCIYNHIEFVSVILKKISNHIYLYVPLFQQMPPNERRTIPRLKVELPAMINDYFNEKVFQLPPEQDVKIIDMSIRGIGFFSSEKYQIDSLHYMYMILDKNKIKTKIILRNEHISDKGYRYGAEIQAITKDDFVLLRRFLLTYQLTNQPDDPNTT